MIFAFLFFFAPVQSLNYWVQPCEAAETGCQAGDPELADWALNAWRQASNGLLELKKVDEPRAAHIRLYWAGERGGLYGEARPIMVNGKRGAMVYVLPVQHQQDGLLRDAIVYLTCLHETGHALGLSHTAEFADIMYSFQFGGDIPEYFGRYRRRLAARDDIRKNAGMSDSDRKRFAELFR